MQIGEKNSMDSKDGEMMVSDGIKTVGEGKELPRKIPLKTSNMMSLTLMTLVLIIGLITWVSGGSNFVSGANTETSETNTAAQTTLPLVETVTPNPLTDDDASPGYLESFWFQDMMSYTGLAFLMLLAVFSAFGKRKKIME